MIVLEIPDKVPETARCNFENGWCGWTNALGTQLNWTLHRGSTPSERTGPSYDHTYRNETGNVSLDSFAKTSRNLVHPIKSIDKFPSYLRSFMCNVGTDMFNLRSRPCQPHKYSSGPAPTTLERPLPIKTLPIKLYLPQHLKSLRINIATLE